MLLKRASARIDRLFETIGDLEQSIGRERLAALRSRVAASDPILLDPERFCYLRVRAISGGETWGPNDNGDYFPAAELAARHHTFVYCPVYLDHRNWDARDAVGIVVASTYHPGPEPGDWVEVIQAIDKRVASKTIMHHLPGSPDLITAIRDGKITDTSMGCFVEYSFCSICGNRATEEWEYCPHIAHSKGMRVQTASGPVVAYEENHGPFFFEDSIICTTIVMGGGGADRDAKYLSEVIASTTTADWRRLLVDRRALLHRATGKEIVMTTPKGVTAGTIGVEGQVSFEPTNPDYPAKTPDGETYDQSKKNSAPGGGPHNAPELNMTSCTEPADYPHTAGRTAAADPASKIGEEPPKVTDAREEIAGEKKSASEEHAEQKKEDAEDGGKKEEDRGDQEPKESIGQRIANAIAGLIPGWRAKVREGEGLRAMHDLLGDLHADHRAISLHARSRHSLLQRQTAQAEMAKVENQIRRALAITARAVTDPAYGKWLDKKVGAMGGNPQELVDREGYEQGDPDSATHSQLGGSSDPAGTPASQRPENVALTDRGDYGQTSPARLARLAGSGWVRTNNGYINPAARVAVSARKMEAIVDRLLAEMSGGRSYDAAEASVLAPTTGGASRAGRPDTRAAEGLKPSRARVGTLYADEQGNEYDLPRGNGGIDTIIEIVRQVPGADWATGDDEQIQVTDASGKVIRTLKKFDTLASRARHTSGRGRAEGLCNNALNNIQRAMDDLRAAVSSGEFYHADNETDASQLLTKDLPAAESILEEIVMSESLARDDTLASRTPRTAGRARVGALYTDEHGKEYEIPYGEGTDNWGGMATMYSILGEVPGSDWADVTEELIRVLDKHGKVIRTLKKFDTLASRTPRTAGRARVGTLYTDEQGNEYDLPRGNGGIDTIVEIVRQVPGADWATGNDEQIQVTDASGKVIRTLKKFDTLASRKTIRTV